MVTLTSSSSSLSLRIQPPPPQRDNNSCRNQKKLLFVIIPFVFWIVMILLEANGTANNDAEVTKAGIKAKTMKSAKSAAAASTGRNSNHSLPLSADDVDVKYLNKQFHLGKKNVESDVLDWICTHASRSSGSSRSTSGSSSTMKIIQFTSFGPSSLVIVDMLSKKMMMMMMMKKNKKKRIGQNHLGSSCLSYIPIVAIDTLHLFNETYELWNTVQEYWPEMQLQVFRPLGGNMTKQQFDQKYGDDLYKMNPIKYAELTKIEPTKRALHHMNANAWITGRRRSQGGERTNLMPFEIDTTTTTVDTTRIKINPLVHWNYEQVWEYIRRNKLPYNSLHDQGYKSIGDVLTTSKVLDANADERSGRFQGLNQSECGMHNLIRNSSNTADDDTATTEQKKNNNDSDKDKKAKYYVDLTPETFSDVVMNTTNDVFVVFYSPYCSHCRVFEPTFFRVAENLAVAAATGEGNGGTIGKGVVAARLDVSKYRVPAYAKDVGLKAPFTPALFLVQHNKNKNLDDDDGDDDSDDSSYGKSKNKIVVTMYSGARDLDSIMSWIKKKQKKRRGR